MKQHLDSLKEREIDTGEKKMILERISKLFLKKNLLNCICLRVMFINFSQNFN